MTIKIREMETIFKKLDVESVTCKHHVRGYVKYKGRVLFPLFYSFGRGDIPGFVTDKIARSMHIKREELMLLARCQMDREEYFERLAGKGIV